MVVENELTHTFSNCVISVPVSAVLFAVFLCLQLISVFCCVFCQTGEVISLISLCFVYLHVFTQRCKYVTSFECFSTRNMLQNKILMTL